MIRRTLGYTAATLALAIVATLTATLAVLSVDSIHSRNQALQVAHQVTVSSDRTAHVTHVQITRLQRQAHRLNMRVGHIGRSRAVLAADVRALTRQLRKLGITPVVIVRHRPHRVAKAKPAGKPNHSKPAPTASPTPTPTPTCTPVTDVCLPKSSGHGKGKHKGQHKHH